MFEVQSIGSVTQTAREAGATSVIMAGFEAVAAGKFDWMVERYPMGYLNINLKEENGFVHRVQVRFPDYLSFKAMYNPADPSTLNDEFVKAARAFDDFMYDTFRTVFNITPKQYNAWASSLTEEENCDVNLYADAVNAFLADISTSVDPQDIVVILHIPGDKGQLKPYIGRFERYAIGKANYVSEAGLLVSINPRGYVNPSLNYLEDYLGNNEGCGVEATEETKEAKGVTYTKLNKAVDVYVQQYTPFGATFNPVFPVDGTNFSEVEFTNWKGERQVAKAVQFGSNVYVLTGFKG